MSLEEITKEIIARQPPEARAVCGAPSRATGVTVPLNAIADPARGIEWSLLGRMQAVLLHGETSFADCTA